MPKIKTHRGAAKRFRATANGGYKAGSANSRHLLSNKSTKSKRRRVLGLRVRDEDAGRVRQMLGYTTKSKRKRAEHHTEVNVE